MSYTRNGQDGHTYFPQFLLGGLFRSSESRQYYARVWRLWIMGSALGRRCPWLWGGRYGLDRKCQGVTV